MSLRAGQLRHLITIQQRTNTRDEYGQPIPAWATFATVWAEVLDMTGREFVESQEARAAEVSVTVIIRYLAGVKPTMRIIHSSRTLQIAAVLDPEGRSRMLQLMCREVDPDGEG